VTHAAAGVVRVRCTQSEVAYQDPGANVAFAERELEDARADGVQLLVLPECFLTGYSADDVDTARRLAIPVGRGPGGTLSELGPHLARLQAAVEEAGAGLVVGFAGSDSGGLYNGAALLVPGRPPRAYCKTHLPLLGFDRFASPGGSLPVFDTPWAKLGILVCFDLRIPEAMRTLALRGAELVVLPTNWPRGAEATPAHYAPTRASENRVFLATCNRVGTEGSFEFIGQSAVHGVEGELLAQAGDGPCRITADIEPARARDKTRVVVPGVYETDTFATRRPSLYEP
jgi:predicted amidohydrolase